jgi:hypothetical protein
VVDTRALVLPRPLRHHRPSPHQAGDEAGTVVGRLLAPLTDVFHELDDLTAFRGAVASVGMHWARVAVASLWPGALIALALSSSRGYDSRSGKLRLLIPAVLLLPLAILGDCTGASHLVDSGLRHQVPCTALGCSGALVCQSEESGDSLHVVRGLLLQHLFITYSLAEGHDDRSI